MVSNEEVVCNAEDITDGVEVKEERSDRRKSVEQVTDARFPSRCSFPEALPDEERDRVVSEGPCWARTGASRGAINSAHLGSFWAKFSCPLQVSSRTGTGRLVSRARLTGFADSGVDSGITPVFKTDKRTLGGESNDRALVSSDGDGETKRRRRDVRPNIGMS